MPLFALNHHREGSGKRYSKLPRSILHWGAWNLEQGGSCFEELLQCNYSKRPDTFSAFTLAHQENSSGNYFCLFWINIKLSYFLVCHRFNSMCSVVSSLNIWREILIWASLEIGDWRQKSQVTFITRLYEGL